MNSIVLPVTAANLLKAGGMYSVFLLVLFLGAKFLPGTVKEGFQQPSGQRKRYKLNGLLLFLLTNGVVLLGVFLGLSLTPVLQYFLSFFLIANLVSILWTLQLFISGRRSADYSPETGSWLPTWLRDVWAGPTLNPTLFGVDMKMWAYQPSLIGLWLIVAAFAFRQYEQFGFLTPQMWLFQIFIWAYLFTHYVREDFMLSTWDIIAEHFGFMLVWGDMVYVPFLYSICGWFLVDNPVAMSTPALLGIAALHILGHWIFRGANWQKDRYKRNPNTLIWGKPAQTLGGRLLISGWWGIGRKINYTGELIVYFTFAFCTGMQSWIPYLLPASLVILLTHRAGRDDRRCQAKYGKLWADYCQKARFRIIPFIY